MEDGDNDARANFEIIARFVDQGKTSWNEGINSFANIMNSEGGANNSSEAQKGFKLAASGLQLGLNLGELSEVYTLVRNNENEHADAAMLFNKILEIAENSRESVGSIARSVITILNIGGGAGNTSDAMSALKVLQQAHRQNHHTFSELVDAYVNIRNHENGNSDTVDTFEHIVEFSSNSEFPLGDTVEGYLRVLNSEGGASNTEDAHHALRALKNSGIHCHDYYTITMLFDTYIMLRQQESSNTDAVLVFNMILNAAKRNRLSVPELRNAYIKLLSSEGGSGNTSDAQSDFRLIMRAIRKMGCSPSVLAQEFIEILHSNSSTSSAQQTFKTIYGL